MDRKTAILVVLSVTGVLMGARLIMSLSRAVHSPKLSSTWTPFDLQRLEIETGARVSRVEWLVSEDDRIAMTSCIVARYTAAIPGGPAALTKMLDGDAETERAISLDAARSCQSEYVERVLGADRWLPQSRTLYLHQCLVTAGALARTWCDCVATEAERRFVSPAAFRRADSGGAPSDSERKALQGLEAACQAAREPLRGGGR